MRRYGGVSGVLQIGDDGLHRDAVHDGLLDHPGLSDGGGVGGGGRVSRVGDDGGRPVVTMVSLEIAPDVPAGAVGDAPEAGVFVHTWIREYHDVGIGAATSTSTTFLTASDNWREAPTSL